jgi:hypothetical protein
MMDVIKDFEDMLDLLEKHKARYLIIGGLAFIYHAKPRYTKDIDLWIDPVKDNISLANNALEEFGSPFLIDPNHLEQILQIGVAPNRIDVLLDVGPVEFEDAWLKRICGKYGASNANWIDIESLIKIKDSINKPKHQEDARILKMVKQIQDKKKRARNQPA